MAPTIIVGDGEDAGDVARRLLDAADSTRTVRVRTDLGPAAYDVDDVTYERFTRSAGDRPDGEARANSVQRVSDAADAEGRITSDDELPDTARVADPGAGFDDIAGPLVGDELPREAINVDPPANGDGFDDGDGRPLTDTADGDVDGVDQGGPQRPAESALKSEWVRYVKAAGADPVWAESRSTTKDDLIAWEPNAPTDPDADADGAGDDE
jgi:hypothetical protein